MAAFQFDGIDEIMAGADKLSQLSDEELYGVVTPAAERLKERYRDKISTLFRTITGTLADSFRLQKKSSGDGVTVTIAPKGKHPGSGRGKRMKRGRSSGKYSGTNAEIGYILEYGSPRIQASHWMEQTNEEAEEEVNAIMADAWDQLITEKGL